ncbi:MAG: hypothetical protein HYZ08_02640 [Candidatus Kerfeldbacteria bacterium]|nr:hypothetical protein [Candidatus Kerfeldbacteria bacterium]
MKMPRISHLIGVMVVAGLVIAVYGWIYAVPSGVLTVEATAQTISHELKLWGRPRQFVIEGENQVMALGNSIPFQIVPPRSFASLDVEVQSDNLVRQSEVTVALDNGEGIRSGKSLYIGDARLDALDRGQEIPDVDDGKTHRWNPIRESGITVWQRDTATQYKDLSAFWNGIHDFSRVAMLNVNLETYLSRADLTKPFLTGPQTFNGTLRGTHTLIAIPKDGRIEFTFDRIDGNRYPGTDDITIQLSQGIHTIDRSLLVRDIDPEVSGVLTHETIRYSDLPDGIYRLKIETSSDVFLRNLTSTHQPILMDGSVMLGDGIAYNTWFSGSVNEPITLTFHGSKLRASIPHVEASQELRIDDAQSVFLTDPDRNPQLPLELGLHAVHIQDRDVRLETDGVFLLSQVGPLVVPPQYQVRGLHNQQDLRFVDYIVEHRETIRQQKDGSWIAQATFTGPELLVTEDGNIQGALHVPNAEEDPERLRFSRVRWIFHKPPISLSDIPRKLWNNIQQRP